MLFKILFICIFYEIRISLLVYALKELEMAGETRNGSLKWFSSGKVLSF